MTCYLLRIFNTSRCIAIFSGNKDICIQNTLTNFWTHQESTSLSRGSNVWAWQDEVKVFKLCQVPNKDPQHKHEHIIQQSYAQLCCMGRGGGNSKKLEDAYQACLQEALSFLDNQAAQTDLHPNDCYSISQVACNFDVSYNTLQRRFQWLNQDAHMAHESQQLLSHVQESVILEWVSNSVMNRSPSPNKAYRGQYSSSPVVVSKQGRTGSRGSLSNILPLNLQSPVAWTWSVQNASTRNQFEITSPYSKRSSTSWRYLGKMSGIWMRKVVSMKGDRKDLQKSTSFPEINDLHTGKRVEILSLSQLLSVSMLLVIQSNLGSSFLGSSITENGWLLTQKFRKSQKRTQIVRY